jgi:threonine dehydratase
VRIIGVESSGAPAMQRSVEEGRRVLLDEVSCSIDGLTVAASSSSRAPPPRPWPHS